MQNKPYTTTSTFTHGAHAQLIATAIKYAFDEQYEWVDRFIALNTLAGQSKNLEAQARARIILARYYWRQSLCATASNLLTPITNMPIAEEIKNEASALIASLSGNYSGVVDRYYRATGRASPLSKK